MQSEAELGFLQLCSWQEDCRLGWNKTELAAGSARVQAGSSEGAHNSTLGHIPNRNAYVHLQKKFIRMFTHRSIIQNSQNLETIQMPISNKMDKVGICMQWNTIQQFKGRKCYHKQQGWVSQTKC